LFPLRMSHLVCYSRAPLYHYRRAPVQAFGWHCAGLPSIRHQSPTDVLRETPRDSARPPLCSGHPELRSLVSLASWSTPALHLLLGSLLGLPELENLPDPHPGLDRVLPFECLPLSRCYGVDGFYFVELPLHLPDLGLLGVAVLGSPRISLARSAGFYTSGRAIIAECCAIIERVGTIHPAPLQAFSLPHPRNLLFARLFSEGSKRPFGIASLAWRLLNPSTNQPGGAN